MTCFPHKILGFCFFLLAGSFFFVNKARSQDQFSAFYKDSAQIIEEKLFIQTPVDTSGFFDRLKKRPFKNKTAKHLVGLMFAEPYHSTDSVDKVQILLERQYDNFKGKTISSVKIVTLDPFGTSIADTAYHNNHWALRTANSIHIQTKEKRIRENLLFKEGDKLDPFLIFDTERILRTADYIQEALIYLQDDPGDSDQVIVTVVVKDVFAMNVKLNIDAVNRGRLGLGSKNILGSGAEAFNAFHWDGDEDPSTGYEARFNYKNIGGTFIDSNVGYLHLFDKESFYLNIDRPFYSPSVKYAGGIGVEHTSANRLYTPDDDTRYYTRRFVLDAWTGRSVFLGLSGTRFQYRNNVSLSGRVYWVNYLARNEWQAPYFEGMQSKVRALGTLAFTRQAYFKSNLIYNFGRSEDIPIGSRLDVTGGFEFHENYRRLYLGLGAGFARLTDKKYYFSIQADAGGFMNAKNLNQAVLNIEGNAFTRLFPLGSRYAFRNFLRLSYVGGYKMYLDEYLSLQDANSGVNSFRSDSVYGNQRLMVDFETSCFTPWKLLGFRTVLFAFANISMVPDRSTALFEAPLYSSVGIGLRMRNEMLVFNTLQIRLSFFPNIPVGTSPQAFQAMGEPYYRPRDFAPKTPGKVPYQ
jgi:hypothetical protein